MMGRLKCSLYILSDGYKLKKSMKNGLTLDCNKDINMSNYFTNCLKFFFERMREVKPNFYYPYLEDNIKKLKVNQHLFGSKCLPKNSKATYFVEDNRIDFLFGQVLDSLYHELMHMVSSIYYNGFSFSGFSQKNGEKLIGINFNEGYTQLLVERYFYDQDVYDSYPFEKMIALYFEKVVGREMMEEDYFNADLCSLQSRVTSYCSIDDFVNFLYDVDYFSYHVLDKGVFRADSFRKKVQDIWRFLFDIYIAKQKSLFDSGEISYSELLNRVRKNVITVSKYKFNKGEVEADFCSKARVKELFLKYNIDFSFLRENRKLK